MAPKKRKAAATHEEPVNPDAVALLNKRLEEIDAAGVRLLLQRAEGLLIPGQLTHHSHHVHPFAVEERCEAIKAAADDAVAKIMQQLKLQLLQLPNKVCCGSMLCCKPSLSHSQIQALNCLITAIIYPALLHGMRSALPNTHANPGARNALQGVSSLPSAGQQRSTKCSCCSGGQQACSSPRAIYSSSRSSTHHTQLAQQSTLSNSSSCSRAAHHSLNTLTSGSACSST